MSKYQIGQRVKLVDGGDDVEIVNIEKTNKRTYVTVKFFNAKVELNPPPHVSKPFGPNQTFRLSEDEVE